MRLKEKILITAVFLSAAFFIVPKIVWAQVVINEVAWMGTKASSADEWIELYNNSNEPISIEGWSLNEIENKLIITLKNSVAANSYYLIERTDDSVTSIPADLFGSWGGSGLSNDGEKISLKDSGGNIIDEIDCSLGWFAGKASPDYQTMERTNPDLPPLATNWHSNSGASISIDAKGNIIQGTPKATNSSRASTPTPTPSPAPSDSPAPIDTSTPSPTPAPGYQYSQQVFINEFLPWPTNRDKEWVELVNINNTTINLSGWQIDDDNASTSPQALPTDTAIAPGEFLVVSFNKNVLNNDGDKIRLLWPDDQVVHTVSYAKAGQGQAVAKFDNGWLWTNQPTPGQANKKSSFVSDNAPSPSPATAEKISPLEENVAVPISAPQSVTLANQKTATPTPKSVATVTTILPTAAALPSANAPEPNLLAAASEPASTAENNSALALAGILILATLAAIGLIYFKRRQQIDNANFDD
ncbi:MAG: lamin tail domain-containing protein [Patescibacteria group bacterium]